MPRYPPWHVFPSLTWGLCLQDQIEVQCTVECCEKYKSFKLKIPQPDSERRHSPDFRTVFGIMIGPFSFCEIGKTWGTNKQVNKQTNKNWKFQFPQPDYRPRHSPDFRTVFGIMIGPFSSCEIGKTWGLRTWEKALYKMRKSEKTTLQWPKVSKLLTTLPRHRADIRTGLRFLFRAPEMPILRVRKSHFYCFSSLQKSHFRCPKRKSETCSEIPSVTWLRGKKFAHFRLLESGFLAFSHFI